MRTRTCVDTDWRFALGDHPEAIRTAYDDADWRLIDLPHDWSIEAAPDPDNPSGAAGGFFRGGIGWYRRIVEVPADLGERRVLIEFDGVSMNSEVWCNGRFCGSRPYAYSSFCYDLTPCVTAGEPAVIAVRVDNSRQPNSRWYTGSGIYRHVWLTLAGPIRVDHWGAFVTTPEVNEDHAVVRCDLQIANDTGEETVIEIIAECSVWHDEPGRSPASSRTSARLLGPQEHITSARLSLTVGQPRLWSPETPNLYRLRILITRDGSIVERHETRFGIRSIRFSCDEGFFLNGRSVKLKGVNEHHDAGCLGAAVPDDAIRRRFRILKEMGCNAIRVAHNPASPAFLDLCDEIGFMVVEDAFDEWRDGKTPFGYQLHWDQWWQRDLADMIRRDRNHPCLIMWSVGNEIKEVREGRTEGLPVMRKLRDVCHREDPTRPMTCGCSNTRETLAAGYGPLMDVVGYNGGGGSCFDYEADHAGFAGMVIFASEVPHTLQTRGVYRTRTWYRDLARHNGTVVWHEPPAISDRMQAADQTGRPPLELMRVPDLAEKEIFTGFDEHYQSSYDNAMVRISAIHSWSRTKRLPFVCGEFRWSGFDYLGECHAWPAKSWNYGVIDLCGFPKDTYHFYRSEWTEAPMVHLVPHWTWPGLEGRLIPVICYTNCDRVELFLNEVLLGVRERDELSMHLRWDVEYRPGRLKAVGYRKRTAGGEIPAAVCEHETGGEAAAITLRCEEESPLFRRAAIAHLVVTVVDGRGRWVPHAEPDVRVALDGPAALVGLENGDPIDTTSYRLDHRRTFHGMMLAIVRFTGEQKPVTIRATTEGLAATTAVLTPTAQSEGA